MWNYGITVEDETDANKSLGIAEVLGNVKPRNRLTKEQFATLLSYFEPFRDEVEYKLNDFDEENQSWRDYAGAVFEDMPPDHALVSGAAYLKTLFES
jgi:hypothetical protein